MEFLRWLETLCIAFLRWLFCLLLVFTCRICFTTMPSHKKFTGKSCSHPYCTACIAQYIETCILDFSMTSTLRCPSVGCKKLLNPLACRPIISARTFVRWCDSLCMSTVTTMDSAYCPLKHCSEVVVTECRKFTTKAKCPRCKRDFCFRCKVKWHQGYRCDKRGIRIAREDDLFEKLAIERGWKRCPSCSRCVERMNGCKVISCRSLQIISP